MVKKLVLALIFLLIATPCWAATELDATGACGVGGADNLLDESLFSAYVDLGCESKIGPAGDQVAAGDHAHTGMLVGPLSATPGALVCTSGALQYTAAACGSIEAGMLKWGATGIPTKATPGTDYVVAETDPIVGAVTGIVKSDGAAAFSAAARSDYAAAQIIGTYSAPQSIVGDYSLSGANSYGFILRTTGTGTVNLPAGVAGMNGCIYEGGAGTVTVNPYGSEIVVRDGTAQGVGVSFTLSSAVGNYVCITNDGTAWTTLGYKGTLAEGT